MSPPSNRWVVVFNSGSNYYGEVLDAPEINFAAGEDFTVLAWVKPAVKASQTRTWPSFFWKREGGRGWEIALRNTVNDDRWFAHLQTAAGVSTIFAPGSIMDDEWHLVAQGRGGSTTRLYQDGQQVGSSGTAGSGDATSTTHLYIGEFVGLMAEIIIYDRLLADEEMEAAWQGNPPADARRVYWPMDEGEGATAADAIGNNNIALVADWLFIEGASPTPRRSRGGMGLRLRLGL